MDVFSGLGAIINKLKAQRSPLLKEYCQQYRSTSSHKSILETNPPKDGQFLPVVKLVDGSWCLWEADAMLSMFDRICVDSMMDAVRTLLSRTFSVSSHDALKSQVQQQIDRSIDPDSVFVAVGYSKELEFYNVGEFLNQIKQRGSSV